MKNCINSFVNNTTSNLDSLPINHILETYAFRELIMGSPTLKTNLCDVFNEQLLYFFYGIPSYRLSKNNKSSKLSSLYPVCIVLDIYKCGVPHRIIALDSGGFDNNIFKDFFHEKTSLDDLSLYPTIETGKKFVAAFYGNNKNYLYNNPLDDIKHNPLEFELEGYIELIRTKQISNYDDRASTLEMQYTQDIELDKTKVKLVVLPAILMDDPEVKKLLEEDWESTVETYTTYRANPNEFMSTIKTKVLDFIEKENK